MPKIEGITGQQFVKGRGDAYFDNRYQYATSSHEGEDRMNPDLVIYAQNKDDIVKALKYAKQNKIAVAVRTGGHQYSGASTCAAPNIQLDVSKTFRGPDDRRIFKSQDGKKTFLYTSISWHLGEFNAFLKANKLFIPHGQCTRVALGGHCQTGGYGQLGRSFGLLGDHVQAIEYIDSNGESRELNKLASTLDAQQKELFYAFLGGSPGNMGIITHLTLEVHRDEDHQGAMAMKVLHLYSKEKLKKLLDVLVKMSDDENFPRNFDLCVNVLSSSFKISDLIPGIDSLMRLWQPEIFGEDGTIWWPRTIIVYAQYIPMGKDDPTKEFVDKWFQDVWQPTFLQTFTKGIEKKPVSEMTGMWIFDNRREFIHPFVKRCYLTNSRTLGKDKWADYVTDRIDALVKPDDNGCYISAQLQTFGGKNSMFYRNRDNGTAYSWRDSTICATLDAFYGPTDGAKENAEAWQAINDKGMIGEKSTFSKQDRRVLWASWGDFDLDKVRLAYYEDEEKYKRIGKARSVADPDGRFTANSFAVKRR